MSNNLLYLLTIILIDDTILTVGGITMQKVVSGVCPVQNKEYSVSVNYIDASTFNKTEYIKGRTHCDYVRFGGECTFSECPIAKLAPEQI